MLTIILPRDLRGWATIFTLTLLVRSTTPVSPGWGVLHASNARVLWLMPRDILDHLAWAARGVCVLDRTVTIRGMVLGRLPPPGHSTDCELRHALSPSLSVKEATCSSWSFELRADSLVLVHI